MKNIFKFLFVLVIGLIFSTVSVKAWYEGNVLNEVEIRNLDASGRRELSNTLLAIYDDNGREVVRWKTNNRSNNVMLKEGTYLLKELDVPEGYKLQEEGIEFNVGSSRIPVSLTNELQAVAIPKTGSVESIAFLGSALVLLTCLILLFYDDYVKRENN
ncbi:MAG: hypothetical protein J6X02_03475 [Bacilli bacterium]|nr:hypothetical protein [Bacilli bacterium]